MGLRERTSLMVRPALVVIRYVADEAAGCRGRSVSPHLGVGARPCRRGAQLVAGDAEVSALFVQTDAMPQQLVDGFDTTPLRQRLPTTHARRRHFDRGRPGGTRGGDYKIQRGRLTPHHQHCGQAPPSLDGMRGWGPTHM